MTTVADLEARKARYEARLEKLYDQADDIADDPRKGYTMDTGDGRISGFFRSPKEVSDEIYRVEREIESICRRLRGAGIQVVRLSRYYP